MKRLSLTFAASFVRRIRHFVGVPTKASTPSHPLASGKCSLARQSMSSTRRRITEIPMVYSYTQISQYLRCPRSYRHRYLDGWREKETRAAMAFGRCFENCFRQLDLAPFDLLFWPHPLVSHQSAPGRS